MKLKYIIFSIVLFIQFQSYAWFWDKITTKIINNTPFDLVVDVIYTGDCPAHNDQQIKAGKFKTIETNYCPLKELYIRHNTRHFVWHTTCKSKNQKNQTFTITHQDGELRINGCQSIEIKKYDTDQYKLLPELRYKDRS